MGNEKGAKLLFNSFIFVGMTRFELATPRPPDEYATRLRHIPIYIFLLSIYFTIASRFFQLFILFSSFIASERDLHEINIGARLRHIPICYNI